MLFDFGFVSTIMAHDKKRKKRERNRLKRKTEGEDEDDEDDDEMKRRDGKLTGTFSVKHKQKMVGTALQRNCLLSSLCYIPPSQIDD